MITGHAKNATFAAVAAASVIVAGATPGYPHTVDVEEPASSALAPGKERLAPLPTPGRHRTFEVQHTVRFSENELGFDKLRGYDTVELEHAVYIHEPGQPRLLAVDHEVVVPVGANVVVGLKSNDVIHDWAVPSFGVKLDAVPGRLQQTWFRAEKEGWFYGQCSELCGRNHAFMPIAVRVVSQDEYDAWVAQNKSAAIDTDGKVASAQE